MADPDLGQDSAIASAARREMSSDALATLSIEVPLASRFISKRLSGGARASVSGRCVTMMIWVPNCETRTRRWDR